jgi:hypothetical protein
MSLQLLYSERCRHNWPSFFVCLLSTIIIPFSLLRLQLASLWFSNNWSIIWLNDNQQKFRNLTCIDFCLIFFLSMMWFCILRHIGIVYEPIISLISSHIFVSIIQEYFKNMSLFSDVKRKIKQNPILRDVNRGTNSP